jgi:hypothetical protein
LDKPEFYKERTRIYEIISIMWLDDFHDNYLDAINDITSNIKNKAFPFGNVTKEGLVKYFRDMTGISNYIDVSKIFKFFIKNCYPFYMEIINS